MSGGCLRFSENRNRDQGYDEPTQHSDNGHNFTRHARARTIDGPAVQLGERTQAAVSRG